MLTECLTTRMKGHSTSHLGLVIACEALVHSPFTSKVRMVKDSSWFFISRRALI